MIAFLNRAGERGKGALRALCLLTRVLFVALRGLYRSWRAQDPTAHPQFRSARRAAYWRLWTMLDNVYWKLRERNSDAPTMHALLRDVNAFLEEHFLYIVEADRVLISQYMLSLQRLRGANDTMNEHYTAAGWDGPGGPMPSAVVDSDGAVQETISLRNRTLLRVRHVFPAE